jgi:rifampicin phosphotransferase
VGLFFVYMLVIKEYRMNDSNTFLGCELKPELDSASVGAKAANLGKVIEHGLDVPLGCVVTRQALTIFLEQNGILESVQDYMADTVDLEQSERIKAYEALCDQINEVPIPQTVLDAVAPLADALFADASNGLAVRSSGIYEDGSKASFAGVYESFLGIRSVDELWDAIRKCWCASWAPHALDYAKRMGIDPEPDAMAVLIQQLVPADSAGVLFTAHPQTGNPWQFTLESTFGLAQELVGSAGATPADRFVFEWDTGKIIEKEIVEKVTMCVSGTSGVENVILSDEQKKASSLGDETLLKR